MKFFWDSNLFIYLWEEGPQSLLAKDFAQWIAHSNHQVITSTLTLGEILVHPFRLGNETRITAYEKAFSKLELIPFNASAAREFAILRATHPTLRPPDAIQIACASLSQADYFVTNDTRLGSIPFPKGLRLLTLDTWTTLRSTKD
ncbi:MAG: type II toxin-antitoxin system VapC family toxin [Verrucomicrobia bacterium]|nr:type II toxin-antitoxin system VapC family toxin [Verrucomicrobiota bacterium]MCH8527839.1 type II toxin-antitoxin system VapC family toxin [Kiritimatiellia bacterium]